MNAIILAAGKGTRLGKITEEHPKCLVSVGDRTILENMLENLLAVKVEEVTIVIGYLGNLIKEKIGSSFHGLKINYVENEIFNTTGTAFSLWKGMHKIFSSEENSINKSILILEGDVFFELKLLQDFIAIQHCNSTLVEKYREGLDGSFVELDQYNQVLQWLHKDMRDPEHSILEMYKTINIHKFASASIRNNFLPLLSKLAFKKQHISLEYVFHEMVKEGKCSIYAYQNDGKNWVEIDDVNDLKQAEAIFAPVLPNVEYEMVY